VSSKVLAPNISFIMLKPDAYKRGLVQTIRQRYEEEFTIIAEWTVKFSFNQLTRFYTKPNAVIAAFPAGFTRDPMDVIFFRGEGAFERGQKMKHEIRRQYGRPLLNEFLLHCPDHDEEFLRQLVVVKEARISEPTFYQIEERELELLA